MDIEHLYYLCGEKEYENKNQSYKEGFINGCSFQRNNLWIDTDISMPFDYSNIYDNDVIVRLYDDTIFNGKQVIKNINKEIETGFESSSGAYVSKEEVKSWMPINFEY